MKNLLLILFCLAATSCLDQSKSSLLPDKAPPMPAISQPLAENSVTMGDLDSFPEMKLDNLPSAAGPYGPTWESIEENYPGEPAWLREAKFGIWVHFGPQASGESGDWYARRLYSQGRTANTNHLKKYGHPSEAGYREVLRDWNPDKLDPAALTKIYQDAGARFLIIQGVHHDNFDLWNSNYHPWNSVNLGPGRDLVGEWAEACRDKGLRFGITFQHEYTWWWWQTAFGSDTVGDMKGVPYDGILTIEDGKGRWWEGLDPRLLYGINLREYKGVADAANSNWSRPPDGIYINHIPYSKWYTTQWALRIMDAIEQYDPDFIYTDGTDQQPFSGSSTGTGIKADAMQRVISYYYNRTLERRGQVNTLSVVKFRHKTNGTITTEEFGIPADIKDQEPWIAEVPVGDWYYAPGFTYSSDMMIRYVIEAIARDGNAAVCISILPDGSLDEGSTKMLEEVGAWMSRNGEAVYGSHSWTIPGEGEIIEGKLKKLPGGKLGSRHANFKFDSRDFRFTIGKNGSLYAFCMTVPPPGTLLKIKSLGTDEEYRDQPVSTVKLLGYNGEPQWKQEAGGLAITCPPEMPFATSIVFEIK
jgi:alpha-L-fucosidase